VQRISTRDKNDDYICLEELCANLESSKIHCVHNALVSIRKNHLATTDDFTAFICNDGKRKMRKGIMISGRNDRTVGKVITLKI